MSTKTHETITFPSKDGLLVTGDYYAVEKPRGFMLLCHRSHFNRGEYREIAPKLQALGFACLAIDQRSGMNVLGVTNETSGRAKHTGLPTGYLDARQDMEAAVDYLFKKASRPIVLVGSSYSASLALLIGKDNEKVGSVVALSPGEYLKGTRVTESLAGFAKPLFVASARTEIDDVTELIRRVDAKYKTQFRPSAEGSHGAGALWVTTEGHEECWNALKEFLDRQQTPRS